MSVTQCIDHDQMACLATRFAKTVCPKNEGMTDITKTSDENKRIMLRSLSLNLTVFYASHSAWIGTHYVNKSM